MNERRITVKCAVCDKESNWPNSRARKYCSKECKIKENELKRTKICIQCGKQFIDGPRNLSKNCSRECINLFSVNKRRVNGSYVMSEEQKEKIRTTAIEMYSKDEMKEKISKAVKKANQLDPTIKVRSQATRKANGQPHWTQTDDGKKRMSDMHKGRKHSEESRRNMSLGAQKRNRTKRETNYTSARGGRREDLNMYFRSCWEANFARIMNFQGKVWEYEPTTFQLENSLSYTPDFLVEGKYYELKGRMSEKSQKQLDLMKEKHPEIILELIDWRAYNELEKDYKNLIPAWE